MTTHPRNRVRHSALLAEDEGYHKGLKPRQLQIIAIGGAIGTGLFLGAGARLQRRTGPVPELRVLRHLRLPDPAGAGRARASPAVVGVLRVVCARIPRREGGLRRRLDVLAELGVHGHRPLHRYCHLLPLLVGVRERPAAADRLARVGGRGEHKTDLCYPVRGARVLGCGHQSPWADDVPSRGHHFLGGRDQIQGQSTGFM